MSELPARTPRRTRRCVIRSLDAAPWLVRLLDTPGLLVAICFDATGDFSSIDYDKLAVVACKSHRELAAQMGIPNLGILRRLTGGALTKKHLRRLRELFANRKALRLLRHMRHICPLIIDSLSCPAVRPHVTSSFLCEIGNTSLESVPRTRDVVELCLFLHEYLPDTTIQSLRHYQRLWEEHKECIDGHKFAMQYSEPFRLPPWADEPGYAVAIRTPRDLVAESVRMRNCAGTSYHHGFCVEIWCGESYFFHIEGRWGLPEATMLCVKDGNYWRIEDVRAYGDREIAQDHVRCLATWVAKKQKLADAEACMPRVTASCCE